MVEQGKAKRETNPYNLIMSILDQTDIEEAYNKEGEEKADERKLNIQELTYFARNFNNDDDTKTALEAFLYHASLQSDADKQKDGDLVQLMTIHASKGLEFPIVYIVGFEEGVFPSRRSLLVQSQLEEERRLAYVAITRGESVVNFSFCERRYNDVSEPSSFLYELPYEIVDFVSSSEYGNFPLGRDIKNSKNNSNSTESKESSETNKVYNIGDKINNKKYGSGVIKSMEKDSQGRMVVKVDFGFIGMKNLILAN